MIKHLLIALFATIVSTLGAQTNPPDAFVYQGLAKNPGTGGIATNTNVRLKVQVLKGGPTGIMVFEENHNTRTNADGIFSVLVGRGNKLVGTTYNSMYDIPWAQDSFYFSLSMSIAMRFPPNSYSPYLPIGTQQFFTVPYAMFAKEAQHVLDSLSVNAVGTYRYIQLGQQTPIAFSVADNDSSMLNELQELVRLGGRLGLKTAKGEVVYTVNLPDSSATNELQKLTQSGNIITLSQGGGSVTIVDNDNQTLAISGQTLMINGGNSVTLPDKDQQTLSLSGNSLSISNGNSVTINPNDADADPNNEIQTISKSGSTITLNKSGGSITDSDNQNLSVSGSSLSISSGNSVTLPDGSSTNELQTLGQTSGKGTITLSQGGGLVTLPDSSASNELQTISKSGSTISLSNSGGSVTDSDNQNLSLSGNVLSISSGNSVKIDPNDADADSTNEIQLLSKSGNKISLSRNGGQVVDNDSQMLSYSNGIVSLERGGSFYLPDTSASNELQSLSLSGDTLKISNGNSVLLTSLSFANGSGSNTSFEILNPNEEATFQYKLGTMVYKVSNSSFYAVVPNESKLYKDTNIWDGFASTNAGSSSYDSLVISVKPNDSIINLFPFWIYNDGIQGSNYTEYLGKTYNVYLDNDSLISNGYSKIIYCNRKSYTSGAKIVTIQNNSTTPWIHVVLPEFKSYTNHSNWKSGYKSHVGQVIVKNSYDQKRSVGVVTIFKKVDYGNPTLLKLN